jgi:hypothetical protein
VLSVGFRGGNRPRRLGQALAVIVRRWRRNRQGEYIYADNRDLLVLGDGSRSRYGAPESVLQPTTHASPVGPLPVAESPSSAPAASTPSRPSAPRGTILYG